MERKQAWQHSKFAIVDSDILENVILTTNAGVTGRSIPRHQTIPGVKQG